MERFVDCINPRCEAVRHAHGINMDYMFAQKNEIEDLKSKIKFLEGMAKKAAWVPISLNFTKTEAGY